MEAKRFGAFVAEMRKERNMTQAQLAAKIGVTDKAVSRWERGLGFPDITTIEPLAEAIGVSVLELMRSQKGEKDAPKEQYSKEEVAEVLQSVADLPGKRGGQDKAANRLGFVAAVVSAALFYMSGHANIGGSLFGGGITAGVCISAYYLWNNRFDEESRRIYGAFCVGLVCLLFGLVSFIVPESVQTQYRGVIDGTKQFFWTVLLTGVSYRAFFHGLKEKRMIDTVSGAAGFFFLYCCMIFLW